MRVGIIAAAGAKPSQDPRLGERDAMLFRSRLELEDVGLHVHVVDPAIDLAEQLDALFDELPEQIDDLVFYASCLLAVVDDGECFLCLDPDEPDVGDSLRDVAQTIAGRARRGTLIVADLRLDDPEADRNRLTEVLGLVQDGVGAAEGVELIAAVRPVMAHNERMPSRLTAGLLEAIDERDAKLTARQAYAAAIQKSDFGEWPSALSYSAGRQPLYFANEDGEPLSREPITEEPPTARPPAAYVEHAEAVANGAARSEPATAEPAAEPELPEPAEDASTEIAVDDVEAPSEEEPSTQPRVEIESDEESGPPTQPSERPPPSEPPSTEPTAAPTFEAESTPASETDPASASAVAADQVEVDDRPTEPEPEPDTTPRTPTDLTPTTPRIVEKSAAVQYVDGIAPAPPSERRVAATVSVPTHLKPSAPASLPKVMIGGRAKKKKPPEPETVAEGSVAAAPPKRRKLFETVADGPKAIRKSTGSDPSPSSEPAPASAPPPATDTAPPPTAPLGSQAAAGQTQPSAFDGDDDANDIVDDESDDFADISIEEEVPKIESIAPPPPPKQKRAIEMTVDDHVSAGDLARTAGREDEALAQFKKALAKLGTQTVPLRAEVYVKIGELMRRKGKVRVAISNFDKALNINPADQRALGALIELNAEAGNWRGVASAEEKFFAGVEDDATRLQHLLGSGDLWREGAKDIKKAKKRYAAARALAPDSTEPLERLVLVHEADGAIEHVLDLRRRIAAMLEDPRQRAESYYALGQYCLDAGREEDGYASFELALDSDPSMLAALEVLASALAEGQEWAELERVYEKMINSFTERANDEASTTVLAELHHRLALLHRDHLEDPASALASLGHELQLRPEAIGTRLMAAELAVELGDPEALAHLRFAATNEPRRADTYHQIFAAAQRHDDTETAFLSASVTTMLEVADDRERLIYQAHKVEGVPALHHPLGSSAWSELKGMDRDRSVDAVMRAIAPAVLRARVQQLDKDGALPTFAPEARQDLETSMLSAVRSLGWACQFLNVNPPVVYIDDTNPREMSAPFAREQTTVIGKAALRGRSLGELAFVAGHHLALRLPEHELVAHLRTTDELSACFLAALKIVLGSAPASGESAKAVEGLAKLYGSRQTQEERDELEAAVHGFSEAGGRVNLHRWIQSVETCAARAGLLLCGDLTTAVAILRADDRQIIDTDVIIDDLVSFAVSDAHIALRQALGVAL